MNQFLPKKSLLQKVASIQAYPFIFIIPTWDERSINPYYSMSLTIYAALHAMFFEYYQELFQKENVHYMMGHIINERIRNGMEHGNKYMPNTNIEIAIWLGEKGVLFAFRDCGKFFSDENIKRKYENREKIETSRPNKNKGGHGTQYLYRVAEDIFVNTKENTLYVTYLLKP